MATETSDEKQSRASEQEEREQRLSDTGKPPDDTEQDVRDRKRAANAIKRRAAPLVLLASCILIAIGLILAYLGSEVEGYHPLSVQSLYVLAFANLVLALLVFIRRNATRTAVLAMMPINLFGLLMSLPLIPSAKYIAMLLFLAEILVMFRKPILEEFDAPQE